MTLTDQQINWLLGHAHVIEINFCDYDQLISSESDVTGKPDDTLLWEASFEEDGLVYEERITLGDIRSATIHDDILNTADGRSLRFKWTRVIAWEQINHEN